MLDIKHYLKTFQPLKLPQMGTFTRKDMPQVNNPEEFLTYLLLHGVNIHKDTINVNNIRMSQCEIDEIKVKNMITAPKKDLAKRIFILSKEFYLLDGHHSVIALMNKHALIKVKVQIVDLTQGELLAMAKQFSGSDFKDLHEGVQDIIKAASKQKDKFMKAIRRTSKIAGMEARETKDMMSTFVDLLHSKISSKKSPTEHDVRKAIEQMKDVGKMSFLVPIFLAPGGGPITIALEMIAKRYGKTILPSSFKLPKD